MTAYYSKTAGRQGFQFQSIPDFETLENLFAKYEDYLLKAQKYTQQSEKEADFGDVEQIVQDILPW